MSNSIKESQLKKNLDSVYQLFSSENMSNVEFESWIKSMISGMLEYQQCKFSNLALKKAEELSKPSKKSST